MIQLTELLHLNIFNSFHLIAGEEGLERTISNVVILEYESIENNYNDFNKGDFVLTSLFFAKDNEDYIYEAFSHLMERDISGIAVKTVYFTNLPSACIALAKEKQVPLFTFSDVYMEDVVINVYDYIKSQQRYYIHEEKVEKLLSSTLTATEVLSLARELNPEFESHVTAMYLLIKDTPGENQLFRIFNQLQYHRSRNHTLTDFFLVKYKKGFLVLYHYDKIPSFPQAEKVLTPLLNSFSLEREQYSIGLCENYYPLEQLDLCIQKSIYAAFVAKFTGVSLLNSSELGLYWFLLPLTENKCAMEYYKSLSEIVMQYDIVNHSDLSGTLKTLNQNGWDIKVTAAKLFQHPNTIRYRLSKAKLLLHSQEDSLFFQLVNTILFLEQWEQMFL